MNKMPKTVSAAAEPPARSLNDLNVTVGAYRRRPLKEAKSSGVVTRGNGAATKGKTARGPLA